MPMRTIKSTVTFARPFTLEGVEETLPAGHYEIETDEELLEGLSMPVWRRVVSYMQLPPDPRRPGLTQTLTVSPMELDTARQRDRDSGEAGLATPSE